MEKISYLHNGQWALVKSNQRFDQDGETHEVEVHPDMDDLYRVKGMIGRSGRPYLHLQDIKHIKTSLFDDPSSLSEDDNDEDQKYISNKENDENDENLDSYVNNDNLQDSLWNKDLPQREQVKHRKNLLSFMLEKYGDHHVKLIDGKLHVLLHRGMDYKPDPQRENENFVFKIDKNKIGHNKHGMWTSMGAASSYGPVHSAWIPLDRVHAFGHSIDIDDPAKVVKDDEHPHVKVNSGMYDYASPDDLMQTILKDRRRRSNNLNHSFKIKGRQ